MNPEYHNPDFDVEAQQAARDAVMEIPLFPELPVQLRKALGYGPHVDMLQHFCYWMHPRKPKMQKRWVMWKTYAQWWEECGLYERQVRKGTKRLKALGVIETWYGPRKRPHYRVDWVELAKLLSITSLNRRDDPWTDEDESDSITSLNWRDAITSLNRSHQSRHLTDVSITEDYAEEYLQESSLLQRAAEPADAEPAVPEMNGKEEEPGSRAAYKHSSQPVGDKRHSQEVDTPGQRTAGKEKVEEPVAPPKPNDDALLAEVKEILNPDSGRWHLATHVSAKHTAETVAKGIVSEDDTGEVVHSAPYEDVEAAVEYLRWEANKDAQAGEDEQLHQNGTAVREPHLSADEGNEHPDDCGCLSCVLPM